jgi:lysozyme
MLPRHRVSRTAIDLIKRFEGYRQNAAQLPDGRWTIGHGHTLTARQGAEVSADDAEALLLYDLIAISHLLNEQVFVTLGQNEFDALSSFVFNIGAENFGRSSVLKRLNEGAPIMAAGAMELWRKAEVGGERIVVDALVRRRAAEKALFLTPDNGLWVPAPSPVLKPLLDTDAFDLIPHRTPVDVTTATTGETIVLLREGEPAQPTPAPPEEDEAVSPALVAAEAVTARLSTIFKSPEPEAITEGPGHQPEPQPETSAEEPFALRAPEFEEEISEVEEELWDDAEEEPRGPDLFETAPANDAIEAKAPDDDLAEAIERDRYVIDDDAPFEFVAPAVQLLPEAPQGGVLTLAALAVLGLTFFGGGAFWAINARPPPPGAFLNPATVGLLAGITGAMFFAVAVYLLLNRLGQASERSARQRR